MQNPKLPLSAILLSFLASACQNVPHNPDGIADFKVPFITFAAASPPSLANSALIDWANAKIAEIQAIDDETVAQAVRFIEPAYVDLPTKPQSPQTHETKLRNQSTTKLYEKTFGSNSIGSLLWTGVESGNPLTRHEEYRWDSLKEEGLYDHDRRMQIAQQLNALGIHNIRLGMSNHNIDLDDEGTWKAADDMIADFASAGLQISLDLHHFGIEDRFRAVDDKGQTVPEKSYYLNPDWPGYFARFATEAVRRYQGQIRAVTIINEPETVIGFNGEMWNGGFPGWSSAQTDRWYLERAFQVAAAAIQARLGIETLLSTLPANQRPRLLYMHTEAAVFKVYWPAFNMYRRFIIGDLILGHDWLMKADLQWLAHVPMSTLLGIWNQTPAKERTNFDWVIASYVVYNQEPEDREAMRANLVKKLSLLRGEHEQLSKKFGKTMRTDTVFAVDYYAHNEDKGKDNVEMSPEPQNYAAQIKAGNRGGLYSVMMDYYNRYQMPMMVGESGTPYYYYGARWNEQMLLETAKAAREGVPFLGYTLYPVTDTWGWESACSVPRNQALFNPSGLLNVDDLTPKPYVQTLLDSLHKQIP